jgi:hypothetical protein
MNKLLIGIVAIGAGVIAGWYIFLPDQAAAPVSQQDATEAAATNSVEDTTSEVTPQPQRGTLQALLGVGQNGYCTFRSVVSDEGESEGEFWFAGDEYRVAAISRIDGEVYTSNVIQTGGRTYVWGGSAAGTQAMVMDTPTETTQPGDTPIESQERVDLAEEVEYECNATNPPALTFTPPADIEFVDMDLMMEGFFEGEIRGMPEGMNF